MIERSSSDSSTSSPSRPQRGVASDDSSLNFESCPNNTLRDKSECSESNRFEEQLTDNMSIRSGAAPHDTVPQNTSHRPRPKPTSHPPPDLDSRLDSTLSMHEVTATQNGSFAPGGRRSSLSTSKPPDDDDDDDSLSSVRELSESAVTPILKTVLPKSDPPDLVSKPVAEVKPVKTVAVPSSETPVAASGASGTAVKADPVRPPTPPRNIEGSVSMAVPTTNKSLTDSNPSHNDSPLSKADTHGEDLIVPSTQTPQLNSSLRTRESRSHSKDHVRVVSPFHATPPLQLSAGGESYLVPASSLGPTYFRDRLAHDAQDLKKQLAEEAKERQRIANSAVRLDHEHEQVSPSRTLSKVEQRPASQKVMTCQKPEVIQRLVAADKCDMHIYYDPHEQLALTKAKTRESRQLKEEKQKELDELETYLALNSISPIKPTQQTEQLRSRGLIIDKICDAWEHKGVGLGGDSRSPRKTRKSRSKGKRASSTTKSPQNLRGTPSSSPKRARSVPVAEDLDSWRHTVKNIKGMLPEEQAYTQPGHRLFEQGGIKRYVKDHWATAKKMYQDELEVKRHSYRPVISSYAKHSKKGRSSVQREMDDARAAERRRVLADRYGDADLDGCTFQPFINPRSALLATPSSDVYARVYSRGVDMVNSKKQTALELQQKRDEEMVEWHTDKKVVLGSPKTETWLQRLMEPRQGSEMYRVHMEEEERRRAAPGSPGPNPVDRGLSPYHLHDDAQKLRQMRQQMAMDDARNMQLTADVGQYLGVKSKILATRHRTTLIYTLFQLFDTQQKGCASVEDIAAKSKELLKADVPQEVKQVLNITVKEVLPVLRSSVSCLRGVSYGEYSKMVAIKMKKVGQYHAPAMGRRSASLPVKGKEQKVQQGDGLVHERLFEEANVRGQKHREVEARSAAMREAEARRVMGKKVGDRTPVTPDQGSDEFGRWTTRSSTLSPGTTDKDALAGYAAHLMRQQLQQQGHDVLRTLFSPEAGEKIMPRKQRSASMQPERPTWKRC